MVEPFVDTAPATVAPPPLTVKVFVVTVEPFILSLKVALIVVVIDTSVAPLDGLLDVTRSTNGIRVGSGSGVGTAPQFVLLPPSVKFAGLISVLFMLFESLTSTKLTSLVPCGFIFHCVPEDELLSLRKFPDAPFNLVRPVMVCVLPASKVSCPPAVVDIRL